MGASARLMPLLVLLPLLGACDAFRKELGLTKNAPDEFLVMPSAPLAMPSNFAELPEPKPGAPRPQAQSPTEQARETIFGAAAGPPSTGTQSPAELALLQTAGADKVDPNIRQIVDAETAQINEDEQTPGEYIAFWRPWPEPGVIVDASAEARRIKENAALGKPITEGETPVVVRKEQALFEGVF